MSGRRIFLVRILGIIVFVSGFVVLMENFMGMKTKMAMSTALVFIWCGAAIYIIGERTKKM
jgi:hypothetical protein